MSKSNNSTSASAGGGIGFGDLLTIAFIVLKLCGVITWPWLWVLSPLWIGLAAFVVLLIIVGIIAAVVR